ncbi:MAG: hypothetical protein ABSF90_17400 [Syntrophobacteraceae bacterium]
MSTKNIMHHRQLKYNIGICLHPIVHLHYQAGKITFPDGNQSTSMCIIFSAVLVLRLLDKWRKNFIFHEK